MAMVSEQRFTGICRADCDAGESVSTMQALIEMEAELQSHRLEVQLVPLNPRLRNWTEYGMKRVCVGKSPRWYSTLCSRHTSSRAIRRGKHDTKIKRRNVERLLARLVKGLPTRSKYAAEILRVAEGRAG